MSGRRSWGPHYMVTHVAEGFSAPGFAPGVEVTHWSGIPISAAVDLNAARFAGSNASARRSRGVQSLTVRPLRIGRHPGVPSMERAVETGATFSSAFPLSPEEGANAMGQQLR